MKITGSMPDGNIGHASEEQLGLKKGGSEQGRYDNAGMGGSLDGTVAG